jgi:formylglycine-generating enzyme required for sulfatase activity
MTSPHQSQLLQALAAAPEDELAWQALADVREEQGDPSGQLLRLHLQVRQHWQDPRRDGWRQEMARLQGAGVKFDLPRLSNHLGMELALIPPGAFLMGSPPDEADRGKDEQQHEVEITRAFGLGVHPVTVGQFAAFAQAAGHRQTDWQAPGFSQDDRHPVVGVSWNDARAFCAWLTKSDSGHVYRLPTEAEWEYACRGGAPEAYPFHVGEPLHCLSSTPANFGGDYPYGGAAQGPDDLQRTTPVGSYPPNGWGLYDLHGNVWEWCADWSGNGYYPQSPRQDPPGPPTGSYRVIRGGNWLSDGQHCRSAFRSGYVPTFRNNYLGFRVALVLSGG